MRCILAPTLYHFTSRRHRAFEIGQAVLALYAKRPEKLQLINRLVQYSPSLSEQSVLLQVGVTAGPGATETCSVKRSYRGIHPSSSPDYFRGVFVDKD